MENLKGFMDPEITKCEKITIFPTQDSHLGLKTRPKGL